MKTFPFKTTLGIALAFGLSACSDSEGSSNPVGPNEPSPNVFEVDTSADFVIRNAGAADYLFSWTDATGTYVDIADPTLVLAAGRTYTFTRASSAHPFRITDSSLPVSGSDGTFSRTTTDGGLIDAVSLTPLEDFTADPAPTTDQITWTPSAGEVGSYFYTCRVTGHTGMTGAIRVRVVN